MSILDFLETNTIELLTQFVIAVCGCMLFSPIGMRFIGKDKPLLGALLGISLFGTLTLIVASFCAILAKYVVGIGYFVGGIITLRNIWQKKVSVKNFIKCMGPFMIIAILFFVKYLVYLIPKNGYILFNCHLTYFADIPIEIFKADYFSRLRVLDCYPYEWAKYHMFGGCFTSIPLALFWNKNLITFTISKYITVALAIGAIYEYCFSKFGREKTIFLMVIEVLVWMICARSLLDQTLSSGHYVSVIYFYLLCLMILEKDYLNGAVIAMFLAISTSRTILIGGILCLYCLLKSGVLVKLKNWNCKFFDTIAWCFINGIGVLVTVFCGDNLQRSVIEVTSIINSTCIGNWGKHIPLGRIIAAIFDCASYDYLLELTIVILYGYLIFNKRDLIKKIAEKYHLFQILSLFIFLQFLYYGYASYFIHGKTFWLAVVDSVVFCYMYVLPCAVITLYLNREEIIPFFIYYAIVLLQGVIFTGEVSIYSYALVFVPLFMCFTRSVYSRLMIRRLPQFNWLINKRVADICVVAIVIVLMFVDFQTFFWQNKLDRHYYELPLTQIPISDEPFEYNCSEDADLAKLNAIKGNRVHYNVDIDVIGDWAIANTTMSGGNIGYLPE